ncbi:UNVERIFIED_CONTAM: hypothetical protein Sradi_3265100 [Sesamum radiatum]|uniref:RNase H type-1 domain-containing protein n=1 Tax=Sesamum radiatum TaxID=300843 RepID=A0AAW2R0A6_SESRA
MNYPLKQVLASSELSGRMVKWAVELSEFGIEFHPRPAIKAQVLADFIVELAYDEASISTPTWSLYVDGSSTLMGSGSGIIIESPQGDKFEYAIKLEYHSSNNEAEYEAFLAGGELALAAGAKKVIIYSDSQLVVNQVQGSYEARDEKMAKYFEKVKNLLEKFEEASVVQISRVNNSAADQLASWKEEVIRFLTDGIEPENQKDAKALRRKESRFVMIDGELYKRGFSQPFLKCLTPEDENYVLREIQEEMCGNHLGGKALAGKSLRQGFFWPTMLQDAHELVRRCRANDQTEVTNQTILQHLKTRLGMAKGAWVDELPSVLLAYLTAPRTATGESPFILSYGTEAVAPAEIGKLSWRVKHYDSKSNTQGMRMNLDLVEEAREKVVVRVAMYKARMAKAYNARVRPRNFQVGDLVMRKAEASGPIGKLNPKWESPYKVVEIANTGAYKLQKLDGKNIPHTWNIANLKNYYS